MRAWIEAGAADWNAAGTEGSGGRGPLQASRTRIVRGIALKTESIPVEDWLDELSANLDERVRTNSTARAALERLIG